MFASACAATTSAQLHKRPLIPSLQISVHDFLPVCPLVQHFGAHLLAPNRYSLRTAPLSPPHSGLALSAGTKARCVLGIASLHTEDARQGQAVTPHKGNARAGRRPSHEQSAGSPSPLQPRLQPPPGRRPSAGHTEGAPEGARKARAARRRMRGAGSVPRGAPSREPETQRGPGA